MSPTREFIDLLKTWLQVISEFGRTFVSSVGSFTAENNGQGQVDPQLVSNFVQLCLLPLHTFLWVARYPIHVTAGVVSDLLIYHTGLIEFELPKVLVLIPFCFVATILLFEKGERTLIKKWAFTDAGQKIETALLWVNAVLGAVLYFLLFLPICNWLSINSYILPAVLALVGGYYNYLITQRRIEFYKSI